MIAFLSRFAIPILIVCIVVHFIFKNPYNKDWCKKNYNNCINTNREAGIESKTFSYRTMPRFTFDAFLSMYNTKPEAWTISVLNKNTEYKKVPRWAPYHTETVPHEVTYHGYPILNSFYMDTTYTKYHPIFWKNYKEFYKYMQWAKQEIIDIDTRAEEKERFDNTVAFAEVVQKDIDAAKAALEKQVAESQKLITEVNNRTAVSSRGD